VDLLRNLPSLFSIHQGWPIADKTIVLTIADTLKTIDYRLSQGLYRNRYRYRKTSIDFTNAIVLVVYIQAICIYKIFRFIIFDYTVHLY